MDFSLSSSLVGNAVLNPDKLSLDLQFAADKTLTARKGPTPVFTRGSSATFVGSNGLIQSAAVNAARFDHDPVTLACKGLLIEESRTNNVFNSGNPTLWNFTGTNEGSLIAPDGSNGLRAGLGTAQLVTNAASTTSATAYTLSVFLKRDNTDWIRVQYNHATNTNLLNAWFNLSTGTVGTVAVGTGTITSISASIVPAGNGWYRCSVTGTTPTTGGLTENIISAVSDNSVSRVAGSIYGVWGGQIEAGSFPTSYIPTTTASVIRSADVCSITGSAFTSIWNGVDATVFFRGSRIANIVGLTNWALTSGTLATTILLDRSGSFERLAVGGTGIITRSPFTTLQEYKTATAVKTGDYAVSFNGETALTSSNTFALSLNAFVIGASYTGVGHLNGWVNSIKFYKKRLPNAKLRTLTV